eukprot:16149891-Heterocapsa_arctica.AAC.1
MAGQVLLSSVPSVARLSLQRLDLRQDLLLGFLDGWTSSFRCRVCEGVGPVVLNAVRLGDFEGSPRL